MVVAVVVVKSVIKRNRVQARGCSHSVAAFCFGCLFACYGLGIIREKKYTKDEMEVWYDSI